VTLYLLRHGIAEDARPGGTDRERRLTSRGRARMRRAARGLKALVGEVDAIYTSAYPRASETAALVAAAIRRDLVPRPHEALTPDMSPMDVVRALRTMRGERLMLVGHEPGLSRTAALLLTGSVDGVHIDLKKGGCVALRVRTAAPRAAILEWVGTPRMLRRVGRRRPTA